MVKSNAPKKGANISSQSLHSHAMAEPSLKERIYAVVAAIPSGKVATYGQVANLAGLPRHARYVGTSLKHTDAQTRLPWHRVLNSKGQISFPVASEGFERQCQRLKAEGVLVTAGKVCLKTHQWQP